MRFSSSPSRLLLNLIMPLLLILYWAYVRQLEQVDPSLFLTQLLLPDWPPLAYAAGFFHWRVLRHFLPLLVGWFFAREAAMLLVQRLYDLPDKRAGLRYLNRLRGGGDGREAIILSAQTLPQEREHTVLLRVGGPGQIYIEPGFVAVTELQGNFHRILPAGLHRLQREEYLYRLLDTHIQERAADNVALRTRDGIPVEAHIGITFCLYRGETTPSPEALFPYDEKAVQKAAYVETVLVDGRVATWEDTPLNAARGLLSQIAAYYTLDQLIAPAGPTEDPLKELTDDLKEKLAGNLSSIGIDLLDVRVGPLKLPESISDAFIEYWRSHLQSVMDINRQEGEAQAVEALDVARAEAEMTMIQAILAGIQRARISGATANMDEIVALRMVEMLESIAAQSRPAGIETEKLQLLQEELRTASSLLTAAAETSGELSSSSTAG